MLPNDPKARSLSAGNLYGDNAVLSPCAAIRPLQGSITKTRRQPKSLGFKGRLEERRDQTHIRPFTDSSIVVIDGANQQSSIRTSRCPTTYTWFSFTGDSRP